MKKTILTTLILSLTTISGFCFAQQDLQANEEERITAITDECNKQADEHEFVDGSDRDEFIDSCVEILNDEEADDESDEAYPE